MSENRSEVSEEFPKRPEKEPGYTTSDPRTHYLELDALRGIAILGVVMLHASVVWKDYVDQPLNVPILNFDLLALAGMGGSGVTLFFLLSGYLLTWTEERRARRGIYSLRSYALRRVLRLVPAYYVALVIGLLLWPTSKTPVDILTHLTFTHGFVPWISFDPVFWSLTPEVVFYALLPLLVLKIRRFGQRLALLVALITIALVTDLIDLYVGYGETLYEHLATFPTTHLWLFIAGGLLRMMVEHIEENTTLGFRPYSASILFLGSSVLFIGFPYTTLQSTLPFSNMITDLLVVLFFAAALLRSPLLLAILRWKPLVFVGTISYSLFLLHNTVIVMTLLYVLPKTEPWLTQVTQQGQQAVWATFAAYIAGIVVVAGALSYLSYRYIESPFLRQKPI